MSWSISAGRYRLFESKDAWIAAFAAERDRLNWERWDRTKERQARALCLRRCYVNRAADPVDQAVQQVQDSASVGSRSITPCRSLRCPPKAKGARSEHGSVLGGKARGARLSSQWKSTVRPWRESDDSSSPMVSIERTRQLRRSRVSKACNSATCRTPRPGDASRHGEERYV
jgi:hypothetical protein